MAYNWIRLSSGLRMVAPLIFGLSSLQAHAQVQSSAPFAYPDMPTTPYGPDWQYCMRFHTSCPLVPTHHAVISPDYEVKDPLPNVTWTMPRSFAGSVSVNRTNHPNNTLFFYAYEREDGSLSAAGGERTGEPWVIWLNGGWVASSQQTSGV
jgi:carboxypeptidase D